MRLPRILLIVSAASLLFVTCKKDTDDPAPSPAGTTVNPLRNYLANNLTNATQSFTVNATTGGSIHGNGDSRVEFAPGVFRTASGAVVNGTVQVKMVEVLTIADMLLMNKQTAGNSAGQLRMLKSGGELKITATQGGSEVFIVPNGATVKIPGSSVDPQMDVFYGTEDSDGELVWNLSADTITISQDSAAWDTTSGNWFYYSFQADSLNWLNCDYFPSGSVTPMTIDPPDGYDGGNTMVWLVVPALNGVLGGWYYGASFNTAQAPIGYTGIIVGLHQDEDDNYFSSFTTVTITPGMTVPITFAPTTLLQFEADVNAL